LNEQKNLFEIVRDVCWVWSEEFFDSKDSSIAPALLIELAFCEHSTTYSAASVLFLELREEQVQLSPFQSDKSSIWMYYEEAWEFEHDEVILKECVQAFVVF
jgi:hypothetical protein